MAGETEFRKNSISHTVIFVEDEEGEPQVAEGEDGGIRITIRGGKAKNAVSVTPSDTEDIDHPGEHEVTNGIYVGAEGDLAVTLEGMDDGESVVFKGVQSGGIQPLRVKRVWNTETTAEEIVAVY